MRNSFKDPALQAQFAKNGYLIIDLYSPQEAARIRAEAARLLPEEMRINDPQEALYLSLFDDDRRDRASDLVRSVATQPLEAMLDDYFDAASHIITKTPGTAALPMHQHQPVTADIFEPVIHAWTTLDDVDETNGALRVIPGSHSILRHVQSFDSKPFFSGFAPALEDRYAVTLPMRAGQAVLFERSLLHGSAPNSSSRPSIRLLSTLLPSESALCILDQRGETFEALEVGRSQVEIDPGLFCIHGGVPAGMKSAGQIQNRNMQISEAQFAALLRSGHKIRPGYDPIDTIQIQTRPKAPWDHLVDASRALFHA